LKTIRSFWMFYVRQMEWAYRVSRVVIAHLGGSPA
jgi:hypothetical protein